MAHKGTPIHPPFEEHLFIGSVSAIGASTVVINLKHQELGDAKVTVGGFIVVKTENIGILGRIDDIHQAEKPDADGSLSLVAKAELLNSIFFDKGAVQGGIAEHPMVRDQCFLAPSELVTLVVKRSDKYRPQSNVIQFQYARLNAIDGGPLAFTPEMIFGRHCAILGSTGGGKSWSVARLIEETAKADSKAILLDATGEYYKLSSHVRHLYLGEDPKPRENNIQVCLPYFHLTESDLFAIFKPKGQSQAPKLREAMRTLKLIALDPSLSMDGTFVKAHKSKTKLLSSYAKHQHEVERPTARFDVSKLPRQIENECVKPNRSSMEPNVWGDINGVDRSLCVPLITRVQDIIQSRNLAPIFHPHRLPSLIEEINDFLRSPTERILRISLQFLSFEHSAREIVANAIGRHLLDLARKEVFRKKPLLILLDEAHQFLNKELENEGNVFALDSFGLIAKEGRKYSLSICIATQRPRDIPESVLSQMGTLIVHRLINDQDRFVVERASGHFDRSSLESLPGLGAGEAVMLGVDFPIPLSVKVNAPDNKPDSKGPDYQRYWQP